ncbi:MAG: efflux RND transporter periplasmic adaptor subunit [Carboxylicivirga sp.]|nr:efflux RND transporter periplasmic adaptor subunit [Carboxylicivirga sp.]
MKRYKNIVRLTIMMVVVGLIVFKLRYNKNLMANEAALAKVKADAIPVHVAQADSLKLASSEVYHGMLEPLKALDIVSEGKGIVKKLHKEKGQWVRQGELIAQLDDEVQQESYLLALRQKEKAEKDRTRFLTLVDGNAVSNQRAEEVELNYHNAVSQLVNAKRDLDNCQIVASADGWINDDYIDEGQYIRVGDNVCDIIDISQMKIRINVPENKVDKLSIGQKTNVRSSLYPNLHLDGTIQWISSNAGDGLKYGVELILNNTKEALLKGGMFMTVEISDNSKKRLIIPRTAVVGSLKAPFVFIVRDGIAQKRSLKLGLITNNYVEVSEGLHMGDQVVISGQINLKESTRVQIR